MSTAAHHGEELIPRPTKTPAALKAALAIVAPNLLPKMQADLEKAFNRAAELDSLTPVHAFLMHWSAMVEIERFPETAREYHRNLYLAQQADTVAEARDYLTVSSEILRAATSAVQE
ncbi:hypothetical protein E6W39_13470 [Kitasatospora acidiphila]|uniref:Uncharacterized protein n=1 Tax=Kitasatospora acidiphila TaxID=2567942 RepID=A0A540W226_9ACTN|nr:DUF6247 family protein [Kitasatospora acidiphila]TQF03078.1 hypothetical protein E6W39_13470 [Kitasatospora acidiphila]